MPQIRSLLKNPREFRKASALKVKDSLPSTAHKPKKNFATIIQELQNEISLLTSYSTDTIYRLDYRSMKYDYISPAIAKLLGFSSQEMKRINFRSLIVETKLVTDGLRKVNSFEELEKKRIGGDVGKWQADYLIRTKSGEKLWVSDVSYPWFDNNGKVIGSVGSLRDITDRVKVELEMEAKISELSDKDQLTGLEGKNAFHNELDIEIKRVARSNSELSIIIFDIDNLKRINADYGRNSGDKVIESFAQLLKASLRETDFLARMSGDSFALILPDTSIRGAFFVAERLRLEAGKQKLSLDANKPAVSFSFSAGIASLKEDHTTNAADLYKAADTRLYIAKNTGKNQVSMDELVNM